MELTEKLSALSLQDHVPIGDPVSKLADEVFKLTIKEGHVTQNSAGHPNDVPLNTTPTKSLGVLGGLDPLFDRIGQNQYKRLSHIDENVDLHCKNVLSRLDSLASPDSTIDQEVLCSLETEDRWLRTTLAQVNGLATTSQAPQLLRGALIERLESVMDAVDCYKIILTDRISNSKQEEPNFYNSGK